MEIYQHILGLLVGGMIAGWSFAMLLNHFRKEREHRRGGIPVWLSGLLLLIGLADLTKAIRDLIKDLL